MRGVLLLALACLCLKGAFPEEKVQTDAEKKASDQADHLYNFLRDLEVQKKKASTTANRYEDFLLKPESERKKLLEDCQHKRKESFSNQRHKDLADYLKSQGITSGRGFYADIQSLEKLKADMDNLEKKDPQKHEALVSDPEARARKLTQCGCTKDEIPVAEPYVFGDIKGREMGKRLGAALHKAGIDEMNMPWFLNELPTLMDSWTQAQERDKDTKEKKADKK